IRFGRVSASEGPRALARAVRYVVPFLAARRRGRGGGIVSIFVWIADRSEPPPQWDLRRLGWTLASGPAEGLPRLLDMRGGRGGFGGTWLSRQSDAARGRCLGVAGARERAALRAEGAGDAFPTRVGLAELAQRAERVAATRDRLPRERTAGPVTLDLLHR